MNAGSLFGLGASGLSYQELVTTPPSIESLFFLQDHIGAGVLMTSVNAGRDADYVLYDGNGSSGDISVSSPDGECKISSEGC